MTQLEKVTSTAVVLDVDDIDTDQIIPARFLKSVDRSGLRDKLFADWHDCPVHQAKETQILVAGKNFGCGSSREHAAWALAAFGFCAVVARSFGDIFRQNALKNGIVPVAVGDDVYAALTAACAADPSLRVTVDVRACTVSWPGQEAVPFAIDAFARRCLVDGLDELAYLVAQLPRIRGWEQERAR